MRRLAGICQPRGRRARTATAASSWHPRVLRPSERVTGSGRRDREGNGSGKRQPPPYTPWPGQLGGPGVASSAAPPGVGLPVGCFSVAAAGRGVKFTVCGGGSVCGGGAFSLPWHTLAQTWPRKGKSGGARRGKDGAWGSGPACESSGVPRQIREAMIRIISVPACHTHYTHWRGGRRWGLGFRPTGCGSCCLIQSRFLTGQSLQL